MAGEASDLGPAAIHMALAEMHEQTAAKWLNLSLTPLEYSQAWRNFSR